MLCPSRIHSFEEGKVLYLPLYVKRKKTKTPLGNLILTGLGFCVFCFKLYPRLNSQVFIKHKKMETGTLCDLYK